MVEVRRKLQVILEGQKEAGKEILKELPDIKKPNKSWGGCGTYRGTHFGTHFGSDAVRQLLCNGT